MENKGIKKFSLIPSHYILYAHIYTYQKKNTHYMYEELLVYEIMIPNKKNITENITKREREKNC